MLSSRSLHVRVVDTERSPLTKASVHLVRLRPEAGESPRGDRRVPKRIRLEREGPDELTLRWIPKLEIFEADRPLRGRYRLTVKARGRETQSRELRLPQPATPVDFVLGKKGQPYYYRGRVKIPFEPRPDLLAVTVGGEDRYEKRSAQVRDVARGLELEEVATSDDIQRNGVLVFAFTDAEPAERQKALERLLAQPEVRLAGPVVEHFEERLVYLTPQYVAKLEPEVTAEKAEGLAREYDFEVVRRIGYAGNSYLIQGEIRADYEVLDRANALADHPWVIYVEPNAVSTTILYAVTPTDFLVPQQWHLPLVDLFDAWQVLRDENPVGVSPGDPGDLTFGSENVTIAVFDSGIQSTTTSGATTAAHPDFQGNVTGGASKVAAFYDFANMVANNDGITNDHGMGCAGVAAARAGNPSSVAGEVEGVVGAASNCRVLGMVVPFGQPNLRWADAFVWMAGLPPGWVADGVTYPVGTTFPAPLASGADVHTNSTRVPDVGLMDDAFDFIAAYGRDGRGVVSLLAAGNTAATLAHSANNTIADHDKVLAIAASINSDVRSGYSCFDAAIDVCAPSSGDLAQTTAGAPRKVTADLLGGGNLAGQTGGPLNYRDSFGGTSSATPLAAGIAALMLSMEPQLNWVQVRELLRNTAVKIDATNTDPVGQWTTDGGGNPVFSPWYGFGRVDAAAAVTAARDHALASDVVIRDNLADTGAVPSAGWHANSPDIWVRRLDDPIPTLAYGAAPPHENPLRGQDNYVFLRVKNVGTEATQEVYLKALICHFPGFEFRYPEEWQPSVPPSSAPPSPMVPGTYLIGEELIDDLAPGADVIVKIPWNQTLIPPAMVSVSGMTVTWHPCILAEASPHDGPPPGGTAHDVKRYNDLAHKNITIVDSGFSRDAFAVGVVAGTTHKAGVRSLLLDRSGVARDARVFLRVDDRELMEAWIDLAQRGECLPADEVPWHETGRDGSGGDGEEGQDGPSQYAAKGGPGALVVRQRTCLTLTCDDGSGWVVDAAPGTRFWPHRGRRAVRAPEVSVDRVEGQAVLMFDGEGGSLLELPMPLAGSTFNALALGVERREGRSFGSLRATQRRADGELSPGYEIVG